MGAGIWGTRTRWTSAVACLAVVALFSPAHAEGAQPLKSAAEISACVKANAPQGDDLREVALITRDRAGNERETRASVFARTTTDGNRSIVVRFTEPAELQSSSLLIVEGAGGRDIYIHSPEMRRPRQISGVGGREGVFGTDFSYDDLIYLQGIAISESGRLERLPDDEIADRPVYVLESRPAAESVGFERIVFSVDQEHCVVLQATFFAPGKSQPRKILSADRIEELDSGHAVPHLITVDDLTDRTRTSIHLRAHYPEPEVPGSPAVGPEDFFTKKPKVDLQEGKVQVVFEPVALVPPASR